MNSEPALTVSAVHKVLGGRTIIDSLELEVQAGELVCLLGPSGCGKTTTLRMIGGFITPDSGRILIDGRDVTAAPPERRPTAMVFQNYALWPHMTVFKNVAFGLRLRKLPKNEIRDRVHAALEMVNLTHHANSHPARISGGEQQRVALARALVLEPQVLLLDEPLSNLDAKLRVRVRDDIKELQQRLQITTVFVTHDQDEALSISDRIAVMNGGDIEQYSDAQGLYSQPSTRFVADFVGTMNIVAGTPGPGTVRLEGGTVVPCAWISDESGAGAQIGIRPEDVRLSVDGAGAEATVVRELPRGHYKEVVVEVGEHRLRSFVGSEFTGTAVRVSFARALIYRNDALAISAPE
ncbi:MAG TPA: ABC transporter ATP-binding protein [Mycobacteriales bacterium]|nr:ABC transporter ATP-binding protein [Mycobacteriales bacterium]